MFINWGSASKAAHVADGGIRQCERCGQESPFQHWVSYTVRHIYGLFRWVTGKEHQLVCGNCGSAFYGDDSVDPKTVSNAIPFFDRRGWTLGVGAIASLAVLGTVASAADEKDNKAYIAAPKVGDIYELDAARLSAKPEAPVMYSTMRVAAVSGDAVTLQLSKEYYADRRGADRDLRQGKAAALSYYGPDAGQVDRAEVAKWFEDGIIVDVDR